MKRRFVLSILYIAAGALLFTVTEVFAAQAADFWAQARYFL